MTAEQFAYWLQGFAEIQRTPPTGEQWFIIKDHLDLVFNKVTPDRTLSSGKRLIYDVNQLLDRSKEAPIKPVETAIYCSRSPLRDDIRLCDDAGVLIEFPKPETVMSTC